MPILVLTLTGAGLIFYHTTEGWFARALPGPEEETFFPPSSPGDIDWPRALAGAQQQFPAATLRVVVWPKDDGWPAIVHLRQPGEWTANGHSKVYIDPSTSLVISTSDSRTLGRGLRLYRLFYPRHAAAVGGRIFDIVVFATGLALAGLGLLGLWSFMQRLLIKRALR